MNNIQLADASESIPREPQVVVARPHDEPDATVTHPTNIEHTAEDLNI